jgi:hypothetical protein
MHYKALPLILKLEIQGKGNQIIINYDKMNDKPRPLGRGRGQIFIFLFQGMKNTFPLVMMLA